MTDLKARPAGGQHALAMLAAAALAGIGRINDSAARVVRALFLLGSILFPGALYTRVLGRPRWRRRGE